MFNLVAEWFAPDSFQMLFDECFGVSSPPFHVEDKKSPPFDFGEPIDTLRMY
jgi:hypothetical protein